MDAADNLYGEHLWYNGERVNTWGDYVWRLNSNNTLDTIIGPSPGFLQNYSFVRDEDNNMYWVERATISRFKRRSPGKKIITLYEGRFNDIRWMYATKKGVIYFIDLADLYKIDTAGKLRLLAKVSLRRFRAGGRPAGIV